MSSSPKLRYELIFRNLFTIVFLGYIIVFFSYFFKSGSNHQKEDNSILSEEKYNNELLKQQISEKNEEIYKLKQNMDLLSSKIVVAEQVEHKIAPQSKYADRPGVIILGMHRSGTSVLGGLMTKMGLKTGGPLIAPAQDNEKGFFERIDVVLQNDYLMQKQGVHYSFNTYKFDALKGLKDILNDDGSLFKEGKRALKFLNDPSNYPWMLKDPRLCITFRMWLPILNFVPVILFTYRHPLDVALSMHKREFEQFKVERGLKMWYVYNRRAIEQSKDLCRVTTSHHLMMLQPQIELDRIYEELKTCGIDVPHKVATTDTTSFIDNKLQHGKSTMKDKSCEKDISSLSPPESWENPDNNDITLYREVMRVYCALEDGSAYDKSFVWDQSIKDN